MAKIIIQGKEYNFWVHGFEKFKPLNLPKMEDYNITPKDIEEYYSYLNLTDKSRKDKELHRIRGILSLAVFVIFLVIITVITA